MIKDIQELNFPSYATMSAATVSQPDMGEWNITSQIKIDGEVAPDFSFDWEVVHDGHKYIMPLRKPQGSKENKSLNSVIDLTFQHWAIYQLKRFPFVTMQPIDSGTAVADEEVATVSLNLGDFCKLFAQVLNYYYGDKITLDFNDDPVTGWQYKAEAEVITISHTKVWNVLIEVFYKQFGVRWQIEPNGSPDKYVIKVGYPTTEQSHIFEYGFEGGLMKVERQVQSEEICNLLKGRGGEKNLPYRYFKNVDPENKTFPADPDWIEELANIYFSNLMPATFRSYVQGWKAAHLNAKDKDGKLLYEGYTPVGEANAYAPWAYRKGFTDTKFHPVEFVADEITIDPKEGDRQVEILPGYSPFVKKDSSLDKYGPLMNSLDNNDEIYPTIQGVTVDPYGRIDEVIEVEPITSDDIEEAVENDAQIEDATFTPIVAKVLPGKNTVIRKGGFSIFEVSPGRTANIIGEAGYRAYRPRDNKDMSDKIVHVGATVRVWSVTTGENHSASGIPEGKWCFTVDFNIENTSNESLNATCAYNNIKIESTTLEDKWSNKWRIWIKNIWQTTKQSGETDAQYAERVWRPILGDRVGNKAKVVFASGMLAHEDYEFVITDIPKYERKLCKWQTVVGGKVVEHEYWSEWCIELSKSDAELDTLGVYLPSMMRQAVAGDFFFFIGIDMPHLYVKWGEERVDNWKKDNLQEKKDIKPTWVVQTDRVKLNGEGREDALIRKLHPGNTLRLADKRFIEGDYETLYLSSLTKTYREPTSDDAALNPDVEIVLSDSYEVSANPVATIQGEVSALAKQVGAISNVEQIVRTVGDKLYLRKDGIPDYSISPTQFFSLLTSGDFRGGIVGGKGWGFFKDENGNWVLETDRLNIRQDMTVNNLIINQIISRGGLIVESAAFMEISNVEDNSTGYKCYFNQKGGTVANLFHVDDVAWCNRFTAENAELKFYKRRVIEVGEDYVLLSKQYANGIGEPTEGDVIVHYGNYIDKQRQYVKVRDVIGGGYERYIEGLDSVNATGTEYYFVGRQAGMYNNRPRWFIGDDNGFIEWVNGKLRIKGDISASSTIQGTNKNLEEFIKDTAETIPGEDAKLVIVNADSQTFVYENDFTSGPNPLSIKFTARLQGDISGYQWSYKLPDDPDFIVIPGQTSNTFNLKHSAAIWGGNANKSITIRCTSSDGVHDEVTVAKISSSISQTGSSVTYAVTKTSVQPQDSDFIHTSIGAANPTSGEYLWTKTETSYSNGTSSKTYSVSRIGSDGTNGTPGAAGANGQTSYVHIAYASGISGNLPHPASVTGFNTVSFIGAKYMGVCTDFNQADPITNVEQTYEWSEIKGADGESYTENLLEGTDIEKTASNEFLEIRNICPVIDQYGLQTYTVSFDIKASKAGSARIYFKPGNNSDFKYLANPELKDVSVDTNWKRVFMTFTPSMSNSAQTYFPICVYCTYGTGVIPSVRNLKLEGGVNNNPVWTPAPSEMLAPTIVSQSVRYAKSSEDTQPADSAFTAITISELNLAKGEYLWSRTIVTYSDGQETKTYSKSYIGVDATPNLLRNSSFKDGFLHWDKSANVSIQNTAEDPNGNFSVLSSQSGLSSDGYRGILQVIPGLKGEHTLTTSVLVKLSSINTPSVGIEMIARDASGNKIGGDAYTRRWANSNITDEWQEIKFSGISPIDSETIAFYIWVQKNGQALFSSPKVEEGENAIPVWNTNPTDNDAYTVVLSDESLIFAGDSEKALPHLQMCAVKVYKGATPVPVKIESISGVPTGMQTEIAGNDTTSAGFFLSVGASENTPLTQKSGSLSIVISAGGHTFTRQLSWALSLNGKDGQDAERYIIDTGAETIYRVDAAVEDSNGNLTDSVDIKPATFQCKAFKQTGGDKVADTDGNLKVSYLKNNTYSNPVAVPSNGNVSVKANNINNLQQLQAVRLTLVSKADGSTLAQKEIPVVIDPVSYYSTFENNAKELDSIKKAQNSASLSVSEIKQTAESIELTVGKSGGWLNLLDNNEQGWIQGNYNSTKSIRWTGGITDSSTSVVHRNLISLQNVDLFSMRFAVNTNLRLYWFDENGEYISYSYSPFSQNINYGFGRTGTSSASGKMTFPSNAMYVGIGLYSNSVSYNVNYVLNTIKPQLEYGDQIHSYSERGEGLKGSGIFLDHSKIMLKSALIEMLGAISLQGLVYHPEFIINTKDFNNYCDAETIDGVTVYTFNFDKIRSTNLVLFGDKSYITSAIYLPSAFNSKTRALVGSIVTIYNRTTDALAISTNVGISPSLYNGELGSPVSYYIPKNHGQSWQCIVTDRSSVWETKLLERTPEEGQIVWMAYPMFKIPDKWD